MNRIRWLALAALLSFVGCVATAQAPDCNLAERRFDNYLGDGTRGGFVARRYEHHALHLGLSLTVADVTHVALKRGPVSSAAIGALTIGVLPHARGLLQHRYPLDTRDVFADATVASLPLVVVVGVSGHSWQSAVLTATTVVAAYLAAACWLSP